MRAAGITAQERFELSSLLAIAMMASQGLGAALVPDIDSPLLAGQRVARIALPPDTEARQFGALWRRTSPPLTLTLGLVQSADAVRALRRSRKQLNDSQEVPDHRSGQ